MEGLESKVVVFAGAGGIATGIAEFLAGSGASVVVGDVRQEAADEAVAAAEKAGGRGIGLTLDISDEDAVVAVMDRAVAEFGRLDGLFNVAANISPAETAKDLSATEIPLESWQRSLDVNLTGYLLTTRHALPRMIGGGGGAIVNTMSGAAFGGSQHLVAYSATKAGVGALTRHTATAYGKQGVRANAVSPGLIMAGTAVQSLSETVIQRTRDAIASDRLGTAADIASAVAFLLSDLSGYVTGQVLAVDGGATMRN